VAIAGGVVGLEFLHRGRRAEHVASTHVGDVREIRSVDELEQAVGGPPLEWVAQKARTSLHPLDVRWIGSCPFIMIATSAPDGTCDVSPKGDPPGFVRVLDATTLAVPERPGNRRVDGYRNVLGNPHVGLIFVVPGRKDTLRVNGRARLVRDADYFDAMAVKGKRPLLAMEVAVEEVFYHCSKAFLRSDLWEPASWRPDELPSRSELVAALERTDATVEELERHYGPAYLASLY
jgi:uncharacterized protein